LIWCAPIKSVNLQSDTICGMC